MPPLSRRNTPETRAIRQMEVKFPSPRLTISPHQDRTKLQEAAHSAHDRRLTSRIATGKHSGSRSEFMTANAWPYNAQSKYSQWTNEIATLICLNTGPPQCVQGRVEPEVTCNYDILAYSFGCSCFKCNHEQRSE